MSLRYMQFNVPVVFDFLEKHRHVLTVRGYDYHTEFAKVADLDATIQRVKVCEVKTIEDLNGFVALSGFKTTREWWKQINIFCKGRKWLYRVTIIDEEGLSAQEQERGMDIYMANAPKVDQFDGVVDRASDHSEYLEYKREIMEIDENSAQEES